MALLRKAPKPEPKAPPSLVASAARMGLNADTWMGYKFADEAWQIQAWDFFDTNSQLHNACDYIGSACSLVRIYVAHVDENGVRQGEVTDDEEIAALADSLFGGPGAKAEILRTLGQSLTVAGECYLIGLASRANRPDRWMVVAPSEVRKDGDNYSILVGQGIRETAIPNRDIVVRVWTPHARRPVQADSPVRALLGILAQMAKTELYLNAQLSSRLANATILPVPETLTIPRGDSETPSPDDILQQIYEVATSNLEGLGTAAQIAPILWPMPLAELEAMKGMEPIKFESILSQQAIDLRKELMEKLAIGINVPVEIQLGAKEMNHWGVWFAGEEFIVKSIMPLMGRIVDAITTAYLYPQLKKLRKDPSRYTYWYDVAPLSSSANQLIDAINLYEKGAISLETLRRVANYNDSDAPSEKEDAKKFIKELLLRDPTLFTVEQVREAVDIFIETALPELTTPPPPPPAPQELPAGPAPGQKPDMRETEGLTDNDDGLIASAAPPQAYVAANSAVIWALERAGGKLLTRGYRGAFKDTPKMNLHTKIIVASGAHVHELLDGAWEHLDMQLDGTGVTAARMRPLLESYVQDLLVNRIQHTPSLLYGVLRRAGV